MTSLKTGKGRGPHKYNKNNENNKSRKPYTTKQQFFKSDKVMRPLNITNQGEKKGKELSDTKMTIFLHVMP